VKVYPIFVDAFPRVSDFPDKPHITTGKSIRKTLDGVSTWLYFFFLNLKS
jgi:hypothetical protein